MRRSKRSRSDPYGGLAGWLFADVALVLAFAFLSSQVISARSNDSKGVKKPPVATPILIVTTTAPKSSQSGLVDVKEIVLSDVCISNPLSLASSVQQIEQKLRDKGEPAESNFGVVLLYAGYRGASGELVDRQADAKDRAAVLQDTLRLWSRLSNKRWVKDLGHDAGTNENCYKLYLLRELNNN